MRRFQLYAHRLMHSDSCICNNASNSLFTENGVVSGLLEVKTVNRIVDGVKKSALLVALATQFAGGAFASGLESPSAVAEEAKAEAPLIVLTPAESSKLTKGEVVLGTADKPNGRRWVTAKVRINAHPSAVWDAVHEERKSDPDLAYSKVLEENKNETTFEQKFQLLPIVGTSVCVIKSNEVPLKRIDYYLLKSDRFKAVEGSWILQPTDDGGTILELGSFIDIGVPAPRTWVEGIAGKKLERRLTNVRKVAEAVKTNKVANNKTDLRVSN